MKKIILIFFITFSLLTSCSYENQTEIINYEKINNVKNEKQFDNQKIKYSMLSKEEKFNIWNTKLNVIISNKYLSKAQHDLLIDLQNNLSKNLFDDRVDDDKKEIFKNIFVKNFLSQSQNLFPYNFIKQNFFNISTLENNIDRLSGVSTCSCNQGSIWSCGMDTSDCRSSSKCSFDSDGCGFMGMFECNGRCYIY